MFMHRVWEIAFDRGEFYPLSESHHTWNLLNGSDCYIREENKGITKVKRKRARTLQPHVAEKNRCTLLLLSNLDNPELVSVKCNEAYLPSIICVTNNTTNATKPRKLSNPLFLREKFCGKQEILFNQRCLYSLWVDGQKKYFYLKKIYQRTERDPFPFEVNLEVFKNIFVAINVQILVFLHDVEHGNRILSVIFTRLWMDIQFEKRYLVLNKDIIQGWFLSYSDTMRMELQTENTYKCKNNAFFSTVYLYDGQDNCKDATKNSKSSDESSCRCKGDPNRYCKGIYIEKQCLCSLFYFEYKNGTCLSFINLLSFINQDLVTEHGIADFICSKKSTTKSYQVNDFVSDCGVVAEDETVYTTRIENVQKGQCNSKNKLPCVLDHSKCYYMSDICIYRLNSHLSIIPCRMASHLQESAAFHCNANFKCPKYYCIPWGYTCDGKRDCPDGFDENNKGMCGEQRSCEHMFRCKDSQICLHMRMCVMDMKIVRI